MSSKNIILIIVVIVLAISSTYISIYNYFVGKQSFGAPSGSNRYERNLLPVADSTYILGTSTLAWYQVYMDELCLAGGTCVTSVSSGGSGGSSVWSTSTDNLIYYNNGTRPFVIGGTATTSDYVSKLQIIGGIMMGEATTTGLTINSERFTDLTGLGLSNSSGVLGLDDFYTKQSWASSTYLLKSDFLSTTSMPTLSITESQISDLDHYTDADVSTYLTSGTGVDEAAGTLSFDCSDVEGAGIDCTGEAITLDPSGNWTGTLDGLEGSSFVYSAFASTTYLQIASTAPYMITSLPNVVIDISTNTNLTAGDHITLTDDDLDVDDDFFLNTGDIITGSSTINSDLSVSGDFFAPNEPHAICFTASSSSAIEASERYEVGAVPFAIEMYQQSAIVYGGTSVVLNFSDSGGTNDGTSITASTTRGTIATAANNTYTAGESITLEVGAVTGTVTQFNICGWFYKLR